VGLFVQIGFQSFRQHGSNNCRVQRAVADAMVNLLREMNLTLPIPIDEDENSKMPGVRNGIQTHDGRSMGKRETPTSTVAET